MLCVFQWREMRIYLAFSSLPGWPSCKVWLLACARVTQSDPAPHKPLLIFLHGSWEQEDRLSGGPPTCTETHTGHTPWRFPGFIKGSGDDGLRRRVGERQPTSCVTGSVLSACAWCRVRNTLRSLLAHSVGTDTRVRGDRLDGKGNAGRRSHDYGSSREPL